MRVVFFGSSQISCIVLEYMVKELFPPVLVVTIPDTFQGRGLKLLPSPVKGLVKKLNLNVITPSSLEDKEFIRIIKEVEPDLFVVISYGKIIPEQLLNIPKIMPLGIHPSLLPAYRGASPINWVLIKGEKVTGVTIFRIRKKVDSGEILIQQEVEIEDGDDALTLHHKLGEVSCFLLKEAMERIKERNYTLYPQDESKASFAPRLYKAIGCINWAYSAEEIRNLIRGLRNWPQAFSYLRGLRVNITEAVVCNCQSINKGLPGEIVKLSKEAIFVACGEGLLKIKKLKPAGKKEMDTSAFLCGHKLKIGDKFGDR